MSDFPCSANRKPRTCRVDERSGRISTDYAEVHYEKGTFKAGTTLEIQPHDNVHGIDIVISQPPTTGKALTVFLNPGYCGVASGNFKFRIKNGNKPVEKTVINEDEWVFARLKADEFIDSGEMGVQRRSGFVILSN